MKYLFVFGAYGALGLGAVDILSKKDFDKIFLFKSPGTSKELNLNNIINIDVDDLSIEQNVKYAFKNIEVNENDVLFLLSTIGGYSGGQEISETSTADFDKMFRNNVKSNFLIAKYFIQLAAKSTKGGAACFISAYTGSHPEAKKGIYGSSKAALNYLIKVMAAEAKNYKIAINGIAPLMIDTPANRSWGNKDDFDKWTKPGEIGELVFQLFNNYNFMSGNIIELTERFKI